MKIITPVTVETSVDIGAFYAIFTAIFTELAAGIKILRAFTSIFSDNLIRRTNLRNTLRGVIREQKTFKTLSTFGRIGDIASLTVNN